MKNESLQKENYARRVHNIHKKNTILVYNLKKIDLAYELRIGILQS